MVLVSMSHATTAPQKPARQNSGWFGWKGNESRNTKQSRHSRSKRKKSKRGSVDPASSASSRPDQGLEPTYPVDFEIRRGFSDDERSVDSVQTLSSDSSNASIASASSDELPARLHQLSASASGRGKHVLRKAIKYMQEQDREIGKLVTTIAKMHKADIHKRDDSHFMKSTKTLRAVVENWSRTQQIITPNPKPEARASIAEILNTPKSSAYSDATRKIGPNYARYLAGTEEDVAKVMQAYLWVMLVRYVFGRNEWAGKPETYANLKAAILPSKSQADRCECSIKLQRVLIYFADTAHGMAAAQTAQYHEWRAMTARLIDQNMEDKQLTKISEKIGYLAMKPLLVNHTKESIDPTFLGIVRRALELDLEMSKQKALFYFSYSGRPTHYEHEETSMTDDLYYESTTSKRNWNVDLFLAPALCKNGTSEGERYDDVQSVILPDEVICSSPLSSQQQQQQQTHMQTHGVTSSTQTYRAPSLQKTHRLPSPASRTSIIQPLQRASTMPATSGKSTKSMGGFEVSYSEVRHNVNGSSSRS